MNQTKDCGIDKHEWRKVGAHMVACRKCGLREVAM